MLPTGVGEPRPLTDDKTDHTEAGWLPDSKAIVFTATEPGHGPRTYLLDIQGGTPRALTPEGTAGTLVMPDGKHIIARDVKRQIWLYAIAGGDPQRLNLTLGSEDFMAGLSPDGKSLLVVMPGIPAKIERVDLATGRREPWKELAPADLAGVQSIAGVKLGANGKSYAYSAIRILSDLYVVDGLK